MRNDIVFRLTDLRRLKWSEGGGASSGTMGCFLKSYEHNGSRRIYYKLSNYDAYRGVFGHESVNELIAARLMDVLGIPHVAYRLIHAQILVDEKPVETWICSSNNFLRADESKIALDAYYQQHRLSAEETPYDFCLRQGWAKQIHQMLLVDYLICNRDRHGANIELIVSQGGEVRPAPLFDHGVSLLFSTYNNNEEICAFDVMRDRPVNNFIGTRSTQTNLRFIPNDFVTHPLNAHDRSVIMRGVEKTVPRILAEKIWNMIYSRWCYYEEIHHT